MIARQPQLVGVRYEARDRNDPAVHEPPVRTLHDLFRAPPVPDLHSDPFCAFVYHRNIVIIYIETRDNIRIVLLQEFLEFFRVSTFLG